MLAPIARAVDAPGPHETGARPRLLRECGLLTAATDKHEEGRIPVSFEYGEDIAALNLPAGTQASVAVYTERVHALSLVRKIVLRMKSWEHFVWVRSNELHRVLINFGDFIGQLVGRRWRVSRHWFQEIRIT